MADGENKQYEKFVPNEELNLQPVDPLTAINDLIADMEQAELDAFRQGLNPWDINLSAMTSQRTQQRITSTLNLFGNLTGNQGVVTNSPGSRMSWGSGNLTQTVRVNQITDANPVFPIGEKNYQFIDYTDKAANLVKYDENGKISPSSPVLVVGIDSVSKKPIMIAESDYKVEGVNPTNFAMSQITTASGNQGQGVRPNLNIADSPDKIINMIHNNEKTTYNSVDEILDNTGLEMVRNLQKVGLLRTTNELNKKTEIQKPNIAPVSEAEKKKRKAYAEQSAALQNQSQRQY